MSPETGRQKATKSGNEFVAFCRLLSLDARLDFNESFTNLGRARVTPRQDEVFTAHHYLADVARSASFVLTAMLRRTLTRSSHRVANHVANFVASDVAPRVANDGASNVASRVHHLLLTLLLRHC